MTARYGFRSISHSQRVQEGAEVGGRHHNRTMARIKGREVRRRSVVGFQ